MNKQAQILHYLMERTSIRAIARLLNFYQSYQISRVTHPLLAMEATLTDDVWTLVEIVALIRQ